MEKKKIEENKMNEGGSPSTQLATHKGKVFYFFNGTTFGSEHELRNLQTS
jgi:hypothetical protein